MAHVKKTCPPDGGYGWVIAGVGFLGNLLIDGCVQSFGAIINPLAKHYDTNLGNIGLSNGAENSLFHITCVFLPPLVSLLGSRLVAVIGCTVVVIGYLSAAFAAPTATMFIVFTGMVGCGLGMLFLSTLLIVSFYFEKKRAIATGITRCGTSLGVMVFPPMSTYLELSYGLQSVFCIYAAVAVLVLVASFLLRPVESIEEPSVSNEDILRPTDNLLRNDIFCEQSVEIEFNPETEQSEVIPKTGRSSFGNRRRSSLLFKDITLENANKCSKALTILKSSFGLEYAKDPIYVMKMLAVMLFDISVYTIPSFIISFIFDRFENNYDSKLLGLIPGMIGIGNLVGRVGSGFYCDYLGISCQVLISWSNLACGSCVFALCWTYNMWVFGLILVLFGFFSAFQLCLASTLIIELYSIENLTKCIGLWMLAEGIASFPGPWIAGTILKQTDSYEVLFYVISAALATSSLLNFVSYKLHVIKLNEE